MRLISVCLFSGAALAQNFARNNLLFRKYGDIFLDDFLSRDPNIAPHVESILAHGCWCAKLDQSNAFGEFLGGPDPVDDLDAICKEWFKCRDCNDHLDGGSCNTESNNNSRQKLKDAGYNMLINNTNLDLASCENMNETCSDDTCTIDLHWVQEMRSHLLTLDLPNFNFTQVVDNSVCTLLTPSDVSRSCVGTAPFLEVEAGGKMNINGHVLKAGEQHVISITKKVHVINIVGTTTLRITVSGAQGGPGRWNGNNGDGAPGGTVSATYKIRKSSGINKLYAIIGEMGWSVSGNGGGGGGSTDVRTYWDFDTEGPNLITEDFYNHFTSTQSLDSRLIVGGAGGGSHGGNYGYWTHVNSPGAGGRGYQTTNHNGQNDNGWHGTGGTRDGPGLDGGASMSSAMTADGVYGGGGIPVDYANFRYSGDSSQGPLTWPNGGPGNNFANGGGGGGWYGGATNWPNGGGGSSYASSSQFNAQNVVYTDANNFGHGQLIFEVVG